MALNCSIIVSTVLIEEPITVLKNTAIAFAIITSVLLMFCVLFIQIKWSHSIIRAASPNFLLLICLGGGCLLGGVWTHIICSVSRWLSDLGFVLAFSPLCLKVYRISKIFNNGTMSVHESKISNLTLLIPIIGLVLVESILQALRLFLDPRIPNRFLPDGSILVNHICHSQFVTFDVLVLAYHIGILSAGSYIAVRAYHAPEIFNETPTFCVITPSWLILMMLRLLADHDNGSTRMMFVLDVFGDLWCLIIMLMVLFAPKIYEIISQEYPEQHVLMSIRNRRATVDTLDRAPVLGNRNAYAEADLLDYNIEQFRVEDAATDEHYDAHREELEMLHHDNASLQSEVVELRRRLEGFFSKTLPPIPMVFASQQAGLLFAHPPTPRLNRPLSFTVPRINVATPRIGAITPHRSDKIFVFGDRGDSKTPSYGRISNQQLPFARQLSSAAQSATLNLTAQQQSRYQNNPTTFFPHTASRILLSNARNSSDNLGQSSPTKGEAGTQAHQTTPLGNSLETAIHGRFGSVGGTVTFQMDAPANHTFDQPTGLSVLSPPEVHTMDRCLGKPPCLTILSPLFSVTAANTNGSKYPPEIKMEPSVTPNTKSSSMSQRYTQSLHSPPGLYLHTLPINSDTIDSITATPHNVLNFVTRINESAQVAIAIQGQSKVELSGDATYSA